MNAVMNEMNNGSSMFSQLTGKRLPGFLITIIAFVIRIVMLLPAADAATPILKPDVSIIGPDIVVRIQYISLAFSTDSNGNENNDSFFSYIHKGLRQVHRHK